MESSKRFSIYRHFKDCFEREHYVDVIWINIYRNALAQFRMGVSQINTHTYRYSKLPEEINYPFCENTPESEIHSLLHCPLYRNLRTRHLVNYNRNISDQENWFASNTKPGQNTRSSTWHGHISVPCIAAKIKKDE